MAIGAIQAIEEAGMKPGKDIIIVSIDGVRGAFEAMIAGKLNVTVECNPLLGPQLMQAVKDLKAGKTLPKRIVTKEGIFPMEVAAKDSRAGNTDLGGGAGLEARGLTRRFTGVRALWAWTCESSPARSTP